MYREMSVMYPRFVIVWHNIWWDYINIFVLALDVFVILCFVMVFLAFLEFALINFLSIFIIRMRSRDLIREPFISTHCMIIIVGHSVILCRWQFYNFHKKQFFIEILEIQR